MHEGNPYGYLTLPDGKPMPAAAAARLTGVTPAEYRRLLAEILASGAGKVDEKSRLFSKRLLKDYATRQARANGGQLGKSFGIQGKEHGVRGGRPIAPRGDIKPPSEPPPSSSSSSSSSRGVRNAVQDASIQVPASDPQTSTPRVDKPERQKPARQEQPPKTNGEAFAAASQAPSDYAKPGGNFQWKSPVWVNATAKLVEVQQRPQEPFADFADRVRQALNGQLLKAIHHKPAGSDPQ